MNGFVAMKRDSDASIAPFLDFGPTPVRSNFGSPSLFLPLDHAASRLDSPALEASGSRASPSAE